MTYQSHIDNASELLKKSYGKFANPTPQTANSIIPIGSWTDPNGIITKTVDEDTLVIPQGYQVQLIASFYTERATGTDPHYAYCQMRWFDETNTTYIGTQATVNSQWPLSGGTNVHCNAALAFVDSSSGAITVSCKMKSFSVSVPTNISASRFSTYGSTSWLAAIAAPV